jgi:RNA polymerase sigma factor (sigma-70 family)
VTKGADEQRERPAGQLPTSEQRKSEPPKGTPPDGAPLDPATINELYQQHADELRRFLLGVLRDPQAAADAMQSALVKAVELGHTAADETRKAWLFRVAYHEALATRRRETNTDRILQTVVWHVSTTERESAAESASRREQAAAVRAALARLPEQLQSVVRLRIHDNLTFAEIAARLEIPLGTALTRMRTALAKLKAVLIDHEP